MLVASALAFGFASVSVAEVRWEAPIGHAHQGLPFADGRQGFLVWGATNELNVTVSRADLWDHRGGYAWTTNECYAHIRDLLYARDVEGLGKLFPKRTKPGEPANPFMLPLGLVRFDLGDWRVAGARLDPFTGLGAVDLVRGAERASVRLALDGHVFALGWPEGLAPKGTAVSSFDLPRVRKPLEKLGFRRAAWFGDSAAGGFEWAIPGDASVSLGFETKDGATFVASARGARPSTAADGGFAAAEARTKAKWTAWWADAAKVSVPDADIQELYDYGMYRFGAMTEPTGVTAPLQGPWYEDCQLPPWSGDYHFNINIEMCYWPAFHGNKLEHLKPMFALVKSWWPILRANAKTFCGIDDGFMLPHSVDDRCTLIGGYWGGTIDHGCTAWIAQLMFRYVQYSGDVAFLKSDAYPFMKGAMNVYRAMMEERDGRLSLAATTSPEWWGDGIPDDGWGRDASFQLAACHRLCRDLLAAAEMLGEKPDPMWLDVERRLPGWSVAFQTSCVKTTDEEIGLFEGKRLPESHRHHSHMAGIVPFDTIDFEADRRTKDLVRETYLTWIQLGPGLWCGWSLPWASMLQTRIGMADMAAYTLKTWKEFFNNPGHGSRGFAYSPGFSLIGRNPFQSPGEGDREIMQMDGAMSAVAAVHEMLCHERKGVVRLFVGAPSKWKRVSFENIRVSGGFLVSATRVNGVATMDVKATRPGVFRWQDPATGRICEREFK